MKVTLIWPKFLFNPSFIWTLTHTACIISLLFQMISDLPYGVSVDWWALGAVMYEMAVGRVCYISCVILSDTYMQRLIDLGEITQFIR